MRVCRKDTKYIHWTDIDTYEKTENKLHSLVGAIFILHICTHPNCRIRKNNNKTIKCSYFG